MLDILVVLIVAGLLVYALKRAGVGGPSLEETKAAGQAFLDQNAEKEGVEVLESGLQILRLEGASDGPKPAATDQVRVHYEGSLIDGTIFDSSIKRGQPIDFGLNQVIPGWTEGLQLMSVGEKARLFLPSDLAYGNRRAGNIPGGSVLIFEVELIAINA